MAYRRFSRRPAQVRNMVVKFAGLCACCGGEIAAGEYATYYPAGTLSGSNVGRIAHVGGIEGNGVMCTEVLRAKHHPEYHAEVLARRAEQRGVNAYAGDGLDERWEDAGRDMCGL